MAKITRMTIRLSENERRQIDRFTMRLRQLGFAGPSALARRAIQYESTAGVRRQPYRRNVWRPTLERGCCATRRESLGGKQALFAVIDTLVKTCLTCVPDPPADGMRNRWRALGTGTLAS